jgi:hypothetical protein
MNHLAQHVVMRFAVYPVLYWIGFAVVKILTAGKAIIMPYSYSESGVEEGDAWWEFRMRRWGYTEWRPESMTIIGGFTVLLLVGGYYVFRYLL